jgi:methyl-accepting chemotaxis protein
MRKHGGQIAQGVAEQNHATKNISSGAADVSHQIGRITQANRQHSAAAETIQKALTDIQGITDRNARGVEESRRATDSLREQTRALVAVADGLSQTGPETATRRRGRQGGRSNG